MITSPIARRYAKALFESVDRDGIDPIRQALTALAAAFEESSELRSVFLSPLYSAEDKRKVLAALASQVAGPALLSNLLSYALKHNRIVFIPEIAAAFVVLADQATGHLSIVVRSSHPVADAQKESLKVRLAESTRRDVDVSFEIDPTLIGGIVVNIGGWVFDGSIKTQVSRWKTALIQE